MMSLSCLLSPEARAYLEASIAEREAEEARRQAEMRKREQESRITEKLRKQFLEDCEAVRLVEPVAYVRFLIAWLNQGGEIADYYDYPLKSAGFYMPTKSSSTPIPAGCGASALNLLIAGDPVEFNLESTSGDSRPGQEFGHGTVLGWKTKIAPDGIQEVEAFTNKPEGVPVYSDVAEILLSGKGN